MRLRSLRKLEEMEIRKEHEGARRRGRASSSACSPRTKRQWKAIAGEIGETAKKFGAGPRSASGRTEIGDAPAADAGARRGPGRARADHRAPAPRRAGSAPSRAITATTAELKYKEGDGPRFVLPAETTDKLVRLRHQRPLLHAAGRPAAGRARPWRAAAPDDRSRQRARHRRAVPLPPGREAAASPRSDGRGFVVAGDEALAQTRTGKQVLNAGRRRAGARLRAGRRRHRRACSATTASC